jgi:hypothetical protein
MRPGHSLTLACRPPFFMQARDSCHSGKKGVLVSAGVRTQLCTPPFSQMSPQSTLCTAVPNTCRGGALGPGEKAATMLALLGPATGAGLHLCLRAF